MLPTVQVCHPFKLHASVDMQLQIAHNMYLHPCGCFPCHCTYTWCVGLGCVCAAAFCRVALERGLVTSPGFCLPAHADVMQFS